MAKIGLQSGVFVSVRDALIAGGGALLSATSDQLGLQLLGLAAIIFGLGHIIWGITADGRPWWRRSVRELPTLKLDIPSIFYGGRTTMFPDEDAILVFVSVTNDGAQSVTPERYNVRIKRARKYLNGEVRHVESNTIVQGGKEITYGPDELIYNKTAEGVPAGARKTGVLTAVFPKGAFGGRYFPFELEVCVTDPKSGELIRGSTTIEGRNDPTLHIPGVNAKMSKTHGPK